LRHSARGGGTGRRSAGAFALALIGTIQVFAVGDVSNPTNGWWHGLHGGLVLFVVALAVFIARRDASALGLTRSAAS